MDNERVEKLIDLGSNAASIQRILDLAANVMERNGYGYTIHNACAATLSTFLREAEIPVPTTLGSGRLASASLPTGNGNGCLSAPSDRVTSG